MHHRLRVMVFLCGLICTLVLPVWAADRLASRRAMAFLQMGAGPRAYAMGEAFSGLADDISALSWNPAGLAQLTDSQILFMHNQWIANIRQEYLAGSYPLFGGLMGAQISYLNSDTQLRRDEDGLLTGDGFNPYSAMAGVGYARVLDYGFSAGASLNYAREQLDDVGFQTGFVDLGGMFRLPQEWWSVGVAIQNLGWPVAGYALPLTIRAGIAARLFDDSLNLTADVARTLFGWFRYSVGAEYWYKNLFALRAGYLLRPEHEGLDTLSGLRAGLGFNIQGYQLDYALIPQGDLGYGHRASFTYFFGGGRALVSEKQVLINQARYRGQQAMAAKDYAAAVDSYQKVLSFLPEDSDAQQALALAQKKAREQEQASEISLRFAKAERFGNTGQWEDAQEEYKRILLMDESNTRAATALAETTQQFHSQTIQKHLRDGREAFKRTQWVDALLAWQAILALDPKHKEAQELLEKTRAEMAKGSQGFKDPRIQEWYLKGLALFERGDYFGASAKWSDVLKLAPKHEQARRYLQEAARLLGEKVKNLIQAGEAYYRAGELVRAAGSWRKVLKVSPKHEQALALIQTHEGEFRERAKHLYMKGIGDYTQGQLQQSVANWQDVLTLIPDYPGAEENIKKAKQKLKIIQ